MLLPLLALAGVQAHAQDDVTIYRCTDAQGRLTIGNTPCAQGQQQQTQSMLRPKDASPAAVPEEDEPVEPPQPVAPRMVVTTAPRPLYECVRPDGSVYESDSGDGDPRWVPLWTLGYPGDAVGYGGMVVQRGGRGGSRSGGISAPPSADISAPRSSGISAPSSSSISIPPPWERPRQSPPPSPPRPSHPGHDGYGYGYGTWVRDECYALPQGEVCERLSDRRDELRRRFFNAQQRERDVLRVEERGLNARLANDCGVN